MAATTPICSKATKVLRLCGGGADRTGGLSTEALAGAGLAPTLLCDSYDLLSKVGDSVVKCDRIEESAGQLRLPPGLSIKGDQGKVASRQAAKDGTKAAPAPVESLPAGLPEPAYVPLPKDPACDQVDDNVLLKVTEEAARNVAEQLLAANLLGSSGMDKMVIDTVCETIKKLKEDVVKVPLRSEAAAPKVPFHNDSSTDVWRLEEAEETVAKVEGVDISLNDLLTMEPKKPEAASAGSRQKLRSSAAPFMSALQQPPPMLQAAWNGASGMGAFPDPSAWSDCDVGQYDASTWKGDWQRKDWLRAQLQYLQCTDQRCVLFVRKIHRLGWESAKKLQEHFEWFGPVERVLVAHDKVRVSRRKETTLSQPAQSGFVVMRHFWDAARILSGGHWQKVAENAIEVMPFRLDCLDMPINREECF